MKPGALRRAGGVVGWLAFLIAALGGLHQLRRGPLSVPPPPDWLWWIAQAGPAVAAAAIVRLGAMAAGWYLVAMTVLNLMLTGTQSRGIAPVVEKVTPRLVLRLLQGLAGATLAASATTTMAAAGPVAADDAPVMRRHHPDVPEPTEVVMMRRLPNAPRSVIDAETPPLAGTRRTVSPGDHFWSIAESELVAVRARPVPDSEIDPYWRQLVAANLAEVPNPDLLFPGQEVRVPSVPPT